MSDLTIWNEFYKEYSEWNQAEADKRSKLYKSGAIPQRSIQISAIQRGDKASEILLKYMGVDGIYSNRSDEEKLEAITRAYSTIYNNSAELMNESIQTMVQKLGLNIKPIYPSSTERVSNLLTKLTGSAVDGQLINKANEWLLGKQVAEDVSRAGVTDSIKANSNFQKTAGLQTVMVRHLGTDGCCDWCRSVAGKYEDMWDPADFWRFHSDCDCWIEYKVEKRADKVSFSTSNGKLSKVTTDL